MSAHNWTSGGSGRSKPIVLIGGPFDGEDAHTEEKLEKRLWVFACANPDCPAEGVHMCWRYDDLPSGCGPAAYDYADENPNKDGVFLYIYGELSDPERMARVADEMELHEERAAPLVALANGLAHFEDRAIRFGGWPPKLDDSGDGGAAGQLGDTVLSNPRAVPGATWYSGRDGK